MGRADFEVFLIDRSMLDIDGLTKRCRGFYAPNIFLPFGRFLNIFVPFGKFLNIVIPFGKFPNIVMSFGKFQTIFVPFGTVCKIFLPFGTLQNIYCFLVLGLPTNSQGLWFLQ